MTPERKRAPLGLDTVRGIIQLWPLPQSDGMKKEDKKAECQDTV